MWAFWFVVLGVAVFATTVVMLCFRRSPMLGRVVFLTSLGALGTIWIAGISLVYAGWNDVDGFVDCYGFCNGWHLTGRLLSIGPPLVALGMTLAVVIGRVLRGRASRASEAGRRW